MFRMPNILIENITNISAKNIFDIKFDSIKGVNINNDFLDTILYDSLIGKISTKKNGIKISYYDENNTIFMKTNISKFEKIIYENKKAVESKNIIKIKKSNNCKYLTRLEITFTNDNNDIVIFDSKVPQNSIFSESTGKEIRRGIAIPLNETSVELYNKFKIIYR